MGIDLNLLRKVAKVYEAAESVDNMPVKHTRESHKKCAPGEFGLNKEGQMPVRVPEIGRTPPSELINAAAPAAGQDKTSALQFGTHVKQALDPALGMAGLGGAGGALAGGLSGLLAPGEYEDEDGNVKRRGRLSTALQRALGMGAVGAGLGGAYGMYDPSGSGKAVDFARQLYQSLAAGGNAKPSAPKLPALTRNPNAPDVQAALASEGDYGSIGNPIQTGGPRRSAVSRMDTPRGEMSFNLNDPMGQAAAAGLHKFMPIN